MREQLELSGCLPREDTLRKLLFRYQAEKNGEAGTHLHSP